MSQASTQLFSTAPLQVLQLSAMPTLAAAVVESSWMMLDAEEPSPLFSAAQIVGLESTAASTVKMLECGVWVCSCCITHSGICTPFSSFFFSLIGFM